MKSMEKYGPSLFDYEGPANLTYQQDQECIVFEGKFQARQPNSGSIAIGFSSTSRSPGTISIGTESGFELSLAGHFPDGWTVTTLGDILSGQPLSLFLGLCQGFTRVAESVQNGPEHWGHVPGIVHSHRGDDGLAGPTAPPCPGVVVGSLVRGNGPPLSARIGLSPVIPSR